MSNAKVEAEYLNSSRNYIGWDHATKAADTERNYMLSVWNSISIPPGSTITQAKIRLKTGTSMGTIGPVSLQSGWELVAFRKDGLWNERLRHAEGAILE